MKPWPQPRHLLLTAFPLLLAGSAALAQVATAGPESSRTEALLTLRPGDTRSSPPPAPHSRMRLEQEGEQTETGHESLLQDLLGTGWWLGSAFQLGSRPEGALGTEVVLALRLRTPSGLFFGGTTLWMSQSTRDWDDDFSSSEGLTPRVAQGGDFHGLEVGYDQPLSRWLQVGWEICFAIGWLDARQRPWRYAVESPQPWYRAANQQVNLIRTGFHLDFRVIEQVGFSIGGNHTIYTGLDEDWLNEDELGGNHIRVGLHAWY